jgi:hypothetical protein
LFFSSGTGIVFGRCILVEKDEHEFRFEFGRDAWDFYPTHWMPLPEEPK